MSNYEINTIVRKLTIRIGAVIIIAVGGMFIKDHFSIANKVTKEEYWKTQYSLMLQVEEKTRALESIAITNRSDISHMSEQITEIKEIQREIDKYLRDENRKRGYNSPLTQY